MLLGPDLLWSQVISIALQRYGMNALESERVELRYVRGKSADKRRGVFRRDKNKNQHILRPTECPLMVADCFADERRFQLYRTDRKKASKLSTKVLTSTKVSTKLSASVTGTAPLPQQLQRSKGPLRTPSAQVHAVSSPMPTAVWGVAKKPKINRDIQLQVTGAAMSAGIVGHGRGIALRAPVAEMGTAAATTGTPMQITALAGVDGSLVNISMAESVTAVFDEARAEADFTAEAGQAEGNLTTLAVPELHTVATCHTPRSPGVPLNDDELAMNDPKVDESTDISIQFSSAGILAPTPPQQPLQQKEQHRRLTHAGRFAHGTPGRPAPPPPPTNVAALSSAQPPRAAAPPQDSVFPSLQRLGTSGSSTSDEWLSLSASSTLVGSSQDVHVQMVGLQPFHCELVSLGCDVGIASIGGAEVYIDGERLLRPTTVRNGAVVSFGTSQNEGFLVSGAVSKQSIPLEATIVQQLFSVASAQTDPQFDSSASKSANQQDKVMCELAEVAASLQLADVSSIVCRPGLAEVAASLQLADVDDIICHPNSPGPPRPSTMIRTQYSVDAAESSGDSLNASAFSFNASGTSLSQPFSPNTSIHASSTPLPPPETFSTPSATTLSAAGMSASATVGLTPGNASATEIAAYVHVIGGSPLSTSAIRNAIADVSDLQGRSPLVEDTIQAQHTSSTILPQYGLLHGLLPAPTPDVAPLPPPPILSSVGIGRPAVENGFYQSPRSRFVQSTTGGAEASLGAHPNWSPSNTSWSAPSHMLGQQTTSMQQMATPQMRQMQEIALIAPMQQMQQMPMQQIRMPQMQQMQQMPMQHMPVQQMQQMQQMPMMQQMQQMQQMPMPMQQMPLPMQLPSALPQPPPSLLGVYPGPMVAERVTPAYPVPVEYPSPVNVDNATPEYAIEYYGNTIQALTFQKTQLPGVANKRKRQKLNSKIDTLTKKRNVLLMQQQQALFMRDAPLNPAAQLYAFGAPAILQTIRPNGSANENSVRDTTSVARSSLNVKAPTFMMPGAAASAAIASTASTPVQVQVEDEIQSVTPAVTPTTRQAPEPTATTAGQQQVAEAASAKEGEPGIGFTSVKELLHGILLAPASAVAEGEDADSAPRPWSTVAASPPKKTSLSAQGRHTPLGSPANQPNSRRLTVLSSKSPRVNMPAPRALAVQVVARDPATSAVGSASKRVRAPAKGTLADRKRQSIGSNSKQRRTATAAAAGTPAPSPAAPQRQQTRRRSSSSSSSSAVAAPLDKENASATPRRRASAKKQGSGPVPQQQQGTPGNRRVSIAVQLRPTGIKLAGTPRGFADGALPAQDSPGGVVEASLDGLVGLKPTGLLKGGHVLRRNKTEKRPESRDGRRESMAFHEKRAMWM